MKIALSSGHGKYISGAVGPSPWGLNEHAEAVKVVNQVAEDLNNLGVGIVTFEDTVSTTQSANLKRIVNWHNAQNRNLDISIHFNSNGNTEEPRGTECLYYSQQELAKNVATAIATASGLKNRGATERTGLYFLANTTKPAILIETCFVNSKADVDIYHNKFLDICSAIAHTTAGDSEPAPPDVLFHVTGKCSSFGGPEDTGVAPDEGLAFISNINQAPQLFLPYQPPDTTGLARRLNSYIHYVACRWNYNITSRDMLLKKMGLAKANGIELLFFPADWGPNETTGRVADLSPGLMTDLKLETDDTVEIIFPYEP